MPLFNVIISPEEASHSGPLRGIANPLCRKARVSSTLTASAVYNQIMKQITLASLQKEINTIKLRNLRVEKDKAWETSTARKISIAVLTYLTILVFFITIKVEKPLINAVVPTLGFLLSTLSLPFIKKLWVNKL